jgi:hypothetical protein
MAKDPPTGNIVPTAIGGSQMLLEEGSHFYERASAGMTS